MDKIKKVEFIGSFQGFNGKKNEFIYTATSINARRYIDFESDTKPSSERHYEDPRCWGWFSSLKQAQKAVEANAGDMMETSFRYVVIEKVPSGIPPMPEDVAWYAWNGSYPKGRWRPCEKPSWANCIVGWSLG